MTYHQGGTNRSATCLRSRNIPNVTTVSDIDDDDSEVEMGTLKGRRAASSVSDAAMGGPAGAGGVQVRNSSGRQLSIALQHIAGDANRAQYDSNWTVRWGVWNHFQYVSKSLQTRDNTKLTLTN